MSPFRMNVQKIARARSAQACFAHSALPPMGLLPILVGPHMLMRRTDCYWKDYSNSAGPVRVSMKCDSCRALRVDEHCRVIYRCLPLRCRRDTHKEFCSRMRSCGLASSSDLVSCLSL